MRRRAPPSPYATVRIADTLGTGLYVSGGTASLTDVEILSTYHGLRDTPAHGAVFTHGAAVTTLRLRISDGADYGVLQEGGTASHTDLLLTGNQTGGLMVGMADKLEVQGISVLDDNGAVNALVLGSHDVTFRNAHLDDAAITPSFLGSDGQLTPVDLGDGLQLIDDDGVVLDGDTLAGNGRAGIVLGMTTSAPATFTGVTVTGSGPCLGAVGGMLDTTTHRIAPMVPGSGWDTGITRLGDVVSNDAALTHPFDVAGIVGPSMIARPDGAAAIVGPSM